MSSSERHSSSSRSHGLKLGLLFVVAYLLLMLLWVPVHWTYPQIKSLLPAGSASQFPDIKRLEGTFWRGRAENISLPLELSSLSWKWDPGALLNVAMGYQLTLGLPQNQARVALAWDRSLAVKDLRLDGSLSDWVSSVQGQPLPLDVAISAQLMGARISEKGCLALQQGQVSLQNWQGLMSESLNRIGRIDATLVCVDGGLQVDFKGQSPELRLSGQWLLGPGLRFTFTAEAQPQGADVEDSLRGAGFVERRSGVWQLARQGRL